MFVKFKFKVQPQSQSRDVDNLLSKNKSKFLSRINVAQPSGYPAIEKSKIRSSLNID